jgi:hypothetical protein
MPTIESGKQTNKKESNYELVFGIVTILVLFIVYSKINIEGCFLLTLIIAGIAALPFVAVYIWLKEKTKSIWPGVVFLLVALSLLNSVVNPTSNNQPAVSTGPCAHVAPEDFQDCLEESTLPDYDPAIRYGYTSEPLSDPIDPYENNNSTTCPNGCTTHISDCDIKGNISFDTGEKIYHVPGQEYYASTTIDSAYGERWFCTEAEARANGWRRSYK